MSFSQLSIVVPVLNEAEQIRKNLRYFHVLASLGCELLFVDGGSSDGSTELLAENNFTILRALRGRASQMNYGAFSSRGDSILFLHVDTRMPECFALQISELLEHPWGYYRVALCNSSWFYRIIAFGINLRARLFKVATGDQAIFVSSSLFKSIGGYKDIELMEDIDLSRRLRALCKPYVVAEPVVVSARRWERNGPLKTAVLMWFLQLAFKLGVSPKRIRGWYQ